MRRARKVSDCFKALGNIGLVAVPPLTLRLGQV